MFPGDELKSIMWKATRSTITTDFEVAMEEMRRIDENAFKHVMSKYFAHQWTRSAFLTHTKCLAGK